MRKLTASVLIILAGLSTGVLHAAETEVQYLSGIGKDDAVLWDFYCTKGRRSQVWRPIYVPSNWELQGFGEYNYGHDRSKSDEQGRYRRTFTVPAAWKGRVVRIVFDGVMTDTQVWINGESAGPVHQGGFYRFKYDISKRLNYGKENLLEVLVSKVSSNPSVEAAERQADYWVFGGIYRPVYLEALPEQFIDWTAVDARADGAFRMDVHMQNIAAAGRVEGQIETPDGEPVGETFSQSLRKGQQTATLRTQVSGQKNWTAETPNLYRIKLTLRDGDREVHTIRERFGFRTFEVRPGVGLFLNGSRIRLKGVDRHSFWPDSGRCLSPVISRQDVALIKSMNMNAVRMSHYPPDAHFLEECDEQGLYVLDELAGWQKPPYDTETGERLVRQMVMRDVNHPCILFWDNANEGGWNRELDDEFAKYDPQNRTVLHPWELFNDVDTDHYEGYESTQNKLRSGNLHMPTEFLHGLYDGGHGAGLNDYWGLLKDSPLGAGGFLWALVDEGVVRTDQNGRIDTDGNHAPDGIVGPYRQKEGSYYTIREIYSPIQIAMESLPGDFDGRIEVENRFHFINLAQCRFQWRLVRFPLPTDGQTEALVLHQGGIPGPAAEPFDRAAIKLDLPRDWKKADALCLTGFDHNGKAVWTWTWPIRSAKDYREAFVASGSHPVQARTADGVLQVQSGTVAMAFDLQTGRLLTVAKEGRQLPLANGPRFVPSEEKAPGADSIAQPRPVQRATASSHQTPNAAANAVDGDLSTRWSAQGEGQWVQLDLGRAVPVDAVAVAWQHGGRRRAKFQVLASSDGENWAPVYAGMSSGAGENLETYAFGRTSARYIRVEGHGNTEGDWNSILEVQVGLAEMSGAAEAPTATVEHGRTGDGGYFIRADKGDGLDRLEWTVLPGGILRLEYADTAQGSYDYLGVTFDCPEHQMVARRWLGAGPYRVWKNRLKGTQFGLWANNYNDPIPGQTWAYPEFKGYFAGLCWTVLETRSGPITMATDTEGLFLRVGTPQNGVDPRYTAAPFPAGNLSVLHAIPPIGTKFKRASDLGPESQPNRVNGTYRAVLYFTF